MTQLSRMITDCRSYHSITIHTLDIVNSRYASPTDDAYRIIDLDASKTLFTTERNAALFPDKINISRGLGYNYRRTKVADIPTKKRTCFKIEQFDVDSPRNTFYRSSRNILTVKACIQANRVCLI